MASIFSITASKRNSIKCLTRLCKISKNHDVTQVAFLKRLSLLERHPKPNPFPYWKSHYHPESEFNGNTILRIDENTRLVVVDGPPAVGKTKLCEKLAEEMGLLYMPQPTHDEIYTNCYGFDIRTLNDKMPESCKSFDLTNYLANPTHKRVASFQLYYFLMRLEQYMNGILHMVATGQGIILNRSIFNDIAFVETMHNAGYLSKDVMVEFDDMRNKVYPYLLRPHLIIYLHASPETTLENIRKRGNRDEINSKVLTKKYLQELEENTKQYTLSKLEPHSHILSYDWNVEGNYLDIMYDIETLDLDSYSNQQKLEDWTFVFVTKLIEYASLYQDKDLILSYLMRTEKKFAPELYVSEDDLKLEEEVLQTEKSEKYAPRCNPLMGDKVFWIKEKCILSYVRRTPRDFVNCNLFKIP